MPAKVEKMVLIVQIIRVIQGPAFYILFFSVPFAVLNFKFYVLN